jgi:opacity protein-like surface antigen
MLLLAAAIFVSLGTGSFNSDDDNYKKNVWMYSYEAGYSWKYAEVGVEVNSGSYKSAWHSTFRTTTLMPTLKLKYPIGKLVPYVVFGCGEAWFDNKKMVKVETVKRDASVAMKYGGGFQYPVTKNVNLYVETAYRYSDTGDGSSLDSWGWCASGGVKYYF